MSERSSPREPQVAPIEHLLAFWEETAAWHDALMQQRRRVMAIRPTERELPLRYSRLAGHALVEAVRITACETVQARLQESGPLLRQPYLPPYRAWDNFPTWAMYAYLNQDANVATAAELVVAGAGDVEAGGRRLLAVVVETEGSYLGATNLAQQELLEILEPMANWEQIAVAFAPVEWDYLDEHGNNPCTTWDTDDDEEGGVAV